eukprot:619311-Heterocapsa_arctica.AAC.1
MGPAASAHEGRLPDSEECLQGLMTHIRRPGHLYEADGLGSMMQMSHESSIHPGKEPPASHHLGSAYPDQPGMMQCQ